MTNRGDSASPDIAALSDDFRATAIAWNEPTSSVRESNRLISRLGDFIALLMDTQEGRRALESLMTDSEPAVRLMAARSCLEWIPSAAVPVLEEIERGRGPAYRGSPMIALIYLDDFRSGKIAEAPELE